VDRVGGRIVAVALGSNLGDRLGHLLHARARLEALLTDLRFSSIRETSPVGVPDEQPSYLNAVAVGSSAATPRALLTALLDIERERGRERPYPNAPRTLDLDLLLVGDLIVAEPDLVLPHSRMAGRAFVLEPLLEIEELAGPAPRWHHPVTGRTVEEMLQELTRSPPGPSTSRR
jgi:2-amino-4-hydroxy-6-hydroxymethyldihydropteridine diphosphokinase